MKDKVLTIIICAILVIATVIGLIIFKREKPKELKYTSDQIVELINKGLSNMKNIYVEKKALTQKHGLSAKQWYLNDKYKIETDATVTIIDIKENKMYVYEKLINKDRVLEGKPITMDIPSEEGYAKIITTKRLTQNEKIEYEYECEELCDGKDCIKFKTLIRNDFSGNDYYYGESYWIEKDTGLIIGYGIIELDGNETIKIYEYSNIEVGSVTESDFELPVDRQLINVVK